MIFALTTNDSSLYGGAANAESPCDFRRAQLLLDAQALDLDGVDRRLAPMVGAARLGGGDALKLALAPEVGFEFSEPSQHVQERLTFTYPAQHFIVLFTMAVCTSSKKPQPSTVIKSRSTAIHGNAGPRQHCPGTEILLRPYELCC